MLCAIDQPALSIDRSIDRAALSMDPLSAQPSIDRAALSVDGFGAGRTDWHGPIGGAKHQFNYQFNHTLFL